MSAFKCEEIFSTQISAENMNEDNICRACLAESGEMRSLFATGTIMGQTAKLVEIILACADLKIVKDDGLPQHICLQCIHQVSRAFSFKRQCEKNQELLLQRFHDTPPEENEESYVSTEDLQSQLDSIIMEENDETDEPNTKTEQIDCIEAPSQGDIVTDNSDTNTVKIKKKRVPSSKRVTEKSDLHRASIYKCKTCGKLFNFLSSLKLHDCKEHSKSKALKCEICSKICRSEEQMKRHMNVHKTGKPFRCEICEKSFCQRAAFVAHTYSHTGERPFLCTECGKAFKQNSELKIHMRMHLDLRPYSCSICGKSYRNSSLFSIHKRVHSGERPFACTFCEKRFISSSCLKNHIMIHTGEKPFTCDYCGRSFNRSNALNIHRKIHTGERPHVCNICGKGFIQAHCLQSHMNTHKTI